MPLLKALTNTPRPSRKLSESNVSSPVSRIACSTIASATSCSAIHVSPGSSMLRGKWPEARWLGNARVGTKGRDRAKSSAAGAGQAQVAARSIVVLGSTRGPLASSPRARGRRPAVSDQVRDDALRHLDPAQLALTELARAD